MIKNQDTLFAFNNIAYKATHSQNESKEWVIQRGGDCYCDTTLYCLGDFLGLYYFECFVKMGREGHYFKETKYYYKE